MTKEQYHEWEKYVRLMEHVWNTSHHSVLKCTPFEAAHGLQARSALDSLTEEDQEIPTDLMTQDGVAAMMTTAKAFEKQIQRLRSEAANTEAARNSRGSSRKYVEGDQVSFYIPPTEKEAHRMGRKPKHLPQYRGPATITKILSNTTYQLSHNDRIYNRCFSELRPYRSAGPPMDLPAAQDVLMQQRKLVVGNYVALCDSNDVEDDHFHLCEVTSIQDGKAVLLNYVTWTSNIKHAKFSVMYQHRSDLAYTTIPPKKDKLEQEVFDWITLEEADEYIDHYNIQMTRSMKIRSGSRKQLRQLGLKHHVLGKTFPPRFGGGSE